MRCGAARPFGDDGYNYGTEMATHSSNLAWRIPWTEEAGGLQFMRSQSIGHDFLTKQQPPAMNQPVDNPDRKGFTCCDLQSKEVPTWLSSPSRSAVVCGPFCRLLREEALKFQVR